MRSREELPMTHFSSQVSNSFKAYDIRGRIPDELNEEVAYLIGRAYGEFLRPKSVCVGRDIRLTSPAISQALENGLADHGCNVVDIGLSATEEIYFVTSCKQLGGGIMVTASHNPADYNGMKLVREESRPISADTGLKDIQRMVMEHSFGEVAYPKGVVTNVNTKEEYIDHLFSYIDVKKIAPLKVVMNCGNGCAGPILERLEPRLPIEFIKIFSAPDGSFPNGIPNPILPENRGVTIDAVIANKADVGIAWDGDCDRCFFFDETGEFIEGYYLVGFLAQAFLRDRPGSKIVHDPRLIWNTVEIVHEHGGIPVMSKSGHAFIKDRMRKEDAVYGGEMSAHHYFKEFAYCDSGMIPWLLLIQTISMEGRPLSELVKARMAKYPVSGEINRTVSDPIAVMQSVEEYYKNDAISIDRIDGVSMEFDRWRFNLRPSNTEPVIRLNVETRQDKGLLEEKTDELVRIIEKLGA